MELSSRLVRIASAVLAGTLCFGLAIVTESAAGVNAEAPERPSGTEEFAPYRRAVDRAGQSQLAAVDLAHGKTVTRFREALNGVEKEVTASARGFETQQIPRLERTLGWLRERAGKDVWRVVDVSRGEIATTRSIVELARGRALERGRQAVAEVSDVLNREAGSSGLTAANSLPIFKVTVAEWLFERRVAAALADVDARIAVLEKSIEGAEAAPR